MNSFYNTGVVWLTREWLAIQSFSFSFNHFSQTRGNGRILKLKYIYFFANNSFLN